MEMTTRFTLCFSTGMAIARTASTEAVSTMYSGWRASVVRQKALPVGIRHDAAQKTAAHDAKFCFHSTNLLFLSSLRMQNTKLSIPCSVWKEKRSAAFLLRGSVLK